MRSEIALLWFIGASEVVRRVCARHTSLDRSERMWFDESAEPEPEPEPLSALHWAVHEDNVEGVVAALSAARESGGEEAVRDLLERRTPPKPQAAYTSPDPDHTAYTWACNQGHADCVEALVRAGCDQTVVTPSGETGLELAVRRSKRCVGCAEVLELLRKLNAERGAAENATAPPERKNWKKLGLGVKLTSFVKEAEFRAGNRLRTLDKQEAERAKLAETTLVESLGEYSARPELRTTMLIIAAELGDVEAVRARLETGASVEAAREDNITALYCACYMAAKHHADRRESRRYLKVVKELLHAGADVNCVGPGGMSPLVCAAKYGALRLCKRLKTAGADPLAATKQGRLTAVAAAMVMGHEDIMDYFLGPRTYFEARETKLSHAAMEAKLGGLVWVADTLESMSERERIAKDVALEAAQRELQDDMERAEDQAQTDAEIEAQAEEEAIAKAKRKLWRDRFKRALARKRQQEWEEAQRAIRPAQHKLRQAFLGYEAEYEERGRGGVGGLPLDNLVGVKRMGLDELLDRARDLAFLKEHPAWHAAVCEVPPPATTRRERRRKEIREELAAWCRDWRLEARDDDGWERSRREIGTGSPVAFGRGSRTFDNAGAQRTSPRTRAHSACNAPIPCTAGTGADAARVAKALRWAEQKRKNDESESLALYQAWVDGGCETAIAVPVVLGEFGPWADSSLNKGTAHVRHRHRSTDVPSCSEWRRARRMPVRVLAAQLNDRGQRLQMALDAIVERCWNADQEGTSRKAVLDAFAQAGGLTACIRLLECIPARGEQPTVRLRLLTLLVMLSSNGGQHRKVMMEQGGVALLWNSFRDVDSGAESQCLGLLGLCNLALEKTGRLWIMQKHGIVNELASVLLNGISGQFCLRHELRIDLRFQVVGHDDSKRAKLQTQDEAVLLLQSTVQSAARKLLSFVGLPAGLVPEPGAGPAIIEILSQRRARWERTQREDPTGAKAAAKKRAEVEAFQRSLVEKEEIFGSLNATSHMVRHGVLSVWKTESKEQKMARAKEDAEAAEVITVAVAQHGDRNAPSICYAKRAPDPERSTSERQALLQFVRQHPAAWCTWLESARPDSTEVEPVRYDPQVWREFWMGHHAQLDQTDEWKESVVLQLERKKAKLPQRRWQAAGRKLRLGAGLARH